MVKKTIALIIFTAFISVCSILIHISIHSPKEQLLKAIYALKEKDTNVELCELIALADNSTPAFELLTQEYSYKNFPESVKYECIRVTPDCVYSILKLEENGVFIEMYDMYGHSGAVYGGKVHEKDFESVIIGETTKSEVLEKFAFSEELALSGLSATRHAVEDGKKVFVYYEYDEEKQEDVVAHIKCVEDVTYDILLPQDKELIDSLYEIQ